MRITSSLCNHGGGPVGADSTAMWTVHASIFATPPSSAREGFAAAETSATEHCRSGEAEEEVEEEVDEVERLRISCTRPWARRYLHYSLEPEAHVE